jgi:hypothetical protein
LDGHECIDYTAKKRVVPMYSGREQDMIYHDIKEGQKKRMKLNKRQDDAEKP